MKRRDVLKTAVLGTAGALVGRSAAAALPKTKLAPRAVKELPARSEVKESDTWDLSKLFPNDEAWEKAFADWQKQIDGYAAVPGQAGRKRRERWPRA